MESPPYLRLQAQPFDYPYIYLDIKRGTDLRLGTMYRV